MKNTILLFKTLMASVIISLALASCDDDESGPQMPIAIFEYEVSDDNSGTVTFENISVEAESYEWDFGDGSGTSTDEHPVYRFSTSGVFHVRLVAKNANGTDDTKRDIMVTTNLVNGGNMEDETAWIFKQVWDDVSNAVDHGFVDGEFRWDNSEGSEYSQSYLWQEIAIEAGKTYKFNANIRSGGTSSIWFDVYFGKVDPDSDGDYGSGGKRTYLSSFGGGTSDCIIDGVDGDINTIAQSGCASPDEGNANLIGPDGTFSLTQDELTDHGTIYLVFKSGSWGSAENYKDGIFLDDVSIVEIFE